MIHKIFLMFLSLSLGTSALSAEIADEPKSDNAYDIAKANAKKNSTTLISEIMKTEPCDWELLIDYGFSAHDFNVDDAHWAIEEYQKGHLMVLSMMLKKREFEDYLTESYQKGGNLLAYSLENGYEEAFAEIIRAFPRLQANVGVTCFQSTIGAPFREALRLKLQDPSMPLIGHLVITSQNSLEKILEYGLRTKKFTVEDIKWAIEEFSTPQRLSQENAEAVFHSIFASDLNQNQKEILIGLITKVTIPKESSLVGSTKYWTGSQSYDEQHNILVECIENGYLSALKIILAIFPKLIDQPIISTIRKEKKSSGWFGSYSEKSYTLASWLMREHNDEQAVYVKEQSPKLYYLEACRIIAKQFMTDYDPENPEKTIDPDLFAMINLVARIDKITKPDSEESK